MAKSPKRVLLIEDEVMLLFALEQTVEDLGYEVADTASSVKDGLRTINGHNHYDLAVLDVNLSGDRSFPIARELMARGVPVLFVTGYGREGVPDEFAACPVLKKPYTDTTLGQAMEKLLG